MDIKLKFSSHSLFRFFMKRIHLILMLIIAVIAVGFIYFTYQTVYLTVIAPKEINKNEIIAKKQKVNLDLFNAINGKIKSKKDIPSQTLDGIKNPF